MAQKIDLAKYEDIDNSKHTAAITAIDVDKVEGRFLLAGGGNGTIYIHDLINLSGKPKYSGSVALHIGKSHPQVHKHSLDTVTWYNDTGMFLTSGRDGILKVWDTNTASVADQFNLGDVVHRHAVNGQLVAVATTSNHVTLVDLKSGSTSHELRGHKKEVSTCTWSTVDGNYLATGGTDCRAILWDLRQSRSFVRYFDFNQVRWKKSSQLKLSGMSHQAAVSGLVFAGCGRYLLSLGKDKRIRKWDVMTGNNLKVKFPELAKFKYENALSIDCSSGGGRKGDILFVPEDCTVGKFEIETGNLQSSMFGHVGQVNCCKYSEINMALYTGGVDRNVLVWKPRGTWDTLWSQYQEETGEGANEAVMLRDSWSSDED